MENTVEKMMKKCQFSEPMNQILKLFIGNQLSPLERNGVLETYGVKLIDIRRESLDVIIGYAETALDDNILTEEEMNELRMLKRYLGIGDNDFLTYGREEAIKHILMRQLELIVADKKVDGKEALMKTDLQELFGLSYDQFQVYEQEIVEDAIKKGANIEDLDVFYEF